MQLRMLVVGAVIGFAPMVAACGEDRAPEVVPTLSAESDRDDALIGQHISGPWTLERTDGRTLVIRVEEGGCLVAAPAVTETSRDVIVASVLQDTSTAGVVCNVTLISRTVEVRLQQAVGDRELLHAYVDPDWLGPGTGG